MMTVAHLITGLGVGGAERMLLKVVTTIPPDKQRHIVISMLDGGAIAEELRASGIEVYSLGMRRGMPSVSAFLKLVAVLKREQPSILQTWLYHADLLGILAARWARVPHVAWNVRCSNTDMSKYRFTSTIVLRFLCWLSGRPDLVLFNSFAGQQFHQRLGYKPRRSKIIVNGFDVTKFRPDARARAKVRDELGIDESSRLIGAVGRYDPAKDYPGFLRACTIMAEADEALHFIIVGDGVTADNPALSPCMQSPALKNRLHFPGERKDVERFLTGFDVFVSPSGFGEGFPNVIGEAMSAAVPTVVTDVGDSARIVDATGLVVPPGNPQILADTVLGILRLGDQDRLAMGAKARERIMKHYSLPSIATQYADTYHDLVIGKST